MKGINDYAKLIQNSFKGVKVAVVSENELIVSNKKTQLVMDVKTRTYKTQTHPRKSGRIGSLLELLKENFN